jgi:hypothetical protein
MVILESLKKICIPFISENPDHDTKEQTVEPGNAYESKAFQSWFETVKS